MRTVHYTIFIVIIIFFSALHPYTRKLDVCAIFQDEAIYLPEWIEFYLFQGAEKIHLYNNESTDNYKEVLQPYIESKKVELLDWKKENTTITFSETQMKAYNHCLDKVRGTTQWLAFLDVDEFLFPLEADNLVLFLKNYEQYGAVCVNWIMFGTSNIETIPSQKLLIESLTKCQIINQPETTFIKSIIQPEKVKNFLIHNALEFYDGFFQVTADHVPCIGPHASSNSLNIAQINHYWPRDEQFLHKVKIPRKFNIYKNFFNNDIETTKKWVLERTEIMNATENFAIQRFVAPLRKILKK